jgi:oligosaccharide repeat unit polymerase
MSGRLAFVNPLAVFLTTWGAVFFLYFEGLSFVLLPLSTEFVRMAIGLGIFSGLCFFAGYFFGQPARTHPLTRDWRNEQYLVRAVHRLISIALALFAVTVIAYQGAPLLWIVLGIEKTYTEFGFPTVHGFFNSLVLITGTIVFWMHLSGRKLPHGKLILAFCIAVPIVTLHRQSMVSLLLQCLFLFAALRSGSLLKAARGVTLFLVICGVLFSVLGNIRTGDEALAGQSNLSGLGDELPLPLVWLYMYLTTPMSNFYELTTIAFEPTFGGSSLAGLTPTVLRQLLWGEPSPVMRHFAEMTFNAYTYAFILFLDFRWWGVYLFTGGAIGWGGVLYRRYLYRPTLYNLLNLCVLNQVVFLFVFANFLLTWGVLFQFVVVRLMKNRLSRVPAGPLERAQPISRKRAGAQPRLSI